MSDELASSATMSESSFQDLPAQPSSSSSDDVDSLPSTSASTTSISPSEEEEYSDAEREWRESLQQLELLLTMVLVPYLGKYFGRKCAYWGMCCNTLLGLLSRRLTWLQAGRSSWNGNTLFTSKSRTRNYSGLRVPLRLLLRYEVSQEFIFDKPYLSSWDYGKSTRDSAHNFYLSSWSGGRKHCDQVAMTEAGLPVPTAEAARLPTRRSHNLLLVYYILGPAVENLRNRTDLPPEGTPNSHPRPTSDNRLHWVGPCCGCMVVYYGSRNTFRYTRRERSQTCWCGMPLVPTAFVWRARSALPLMGRERGRLFLPKEQ